MTIMVSHQAVPPHFTTKLRPCTGHGRPLIKFHAGCEQSLVCVVINNSSYPTVKNNSAAYHAFGKH